MPFQGEIHFWFGDPRALPSATMEEAFGLVAGGPRALPSATMGWAFGPFHLRREPRYGPRLFAPRVVFA
jgi:hypothetical protein